MTSEVQLPVEATAAAPRPAAVDASLLDRALATAGDWLNPILVKEARQALKSRQFVGTFGLLLAAGWLVTIVGVSAIGPDIYHSSSGAEMFAGYYFILLFALLVIVPFGAYRSLAAEQEDRSYELLSITTLSARQIIRGKLGSAVVQMAVYLSAISPCLAFTYLLRGIDLPTILLMLFYAVAGSLGLSMIALLLGALTSVRHSQAVLSVGVVVGLMLAFWGGCAFTGIMLSMPPLSLSDSSFWLVNALILSVCAGYFVLCYDAAAAQITFAADNRSTRPRASMLGVHLLITGWVCWFYASGPSQGEFDNSFGPYLAGLALHWYAMGAVLNGEAAEMSPRVKRRLPQSFLGRVFLTWFNPGPGTGYVFALASMASAVLFVSLVAVVTSEQWLLHPLWQAKTTSLRTQHPWPDIAMGLLATAYLTIYLGVGQLLIRLLRRFARCGMTAAVLLQLLLATVGVATPLIVQGLVFQWRGSDYSLLQITNPFWSCLEVVDGGFRAGGGLSVAGTMLLVIVPLAAIGVFLLNVPGIVAELRQVRISRPPRVAEDDRQLATASGPTMPTHVSPWD
jgi:hypothetical protein